LQEQYNPKIIDSLNRIARILQREDKYLKDTVYGILQDWKIFPISKDGEIEIELAKVMELPEALKFRLIKTILDHYFLSNQRMTSKHINSVVNLITSLKPDCSIILPGKLSVRREYERLTIGEKNRPKYREGSFSVESSDVEKFFYPVIIPCVVEIKEISCVIKTSFVEDVSEFHHQDLCKSRDYTYFDYNKAKMPLVIRNRREGDRFQPIGMTGTKKLKTYFIDEKIPRRRRDLIPLLADRHSVIWISGMRLSERVKIDENTSRIAKIEII
jgi:tRNA(Ile)-lysidine synthase